MYGIGFYSYQTFSAAKEFKAQRHIGLVLLGVNPYVACYDGWIEDMSNDGILIFVAPKNLRR